jgi:hypothetical protein
VHKGRSFAKLNRKSENQYYVKRIVIVGCVMVSVLAVGSKVHGFKLG